MKTIKYLLLLIITILIAALAYFNQEYFMAVVSFKFNIKDVVYTIPGLPTIAYFGICFLLGLILAGMGTISAKFGLKKTIKKQGSLIHELNTKIIDLKNELYVFTHDPYIKKGLADKASAESVIVPEAETQTESVVEAAIEAPIEALGETPVEIEAEAELEAETNSEPNIDPDTEPDTEPEVEPDVEPDAEIQETDNPEEDSNPIIL